MKILIIEDEIMILKSLEFKLKKEGFDVSIAEDGRIAMELIDNNNYDCILTDLLIPFYGGIELINHIRNVLKKNTPIIVLSGIGQEESIMEAFKLGANDYMTKPFSPNELIIRINKQLIQK